MSDTLQYLIVGLIVALCLGYMLRRLLLRLGRGGKAAQAPGCGRCGACGGCEQQGRGGGCH